MLLTPYRVVRECTNYMSFLGPFSTALSPMWMVGYPIVSVQNRIVCEKYLHTSRDLTSVIALCKGNIMTSTLHCLRHIQATEGWTGLFRGFSATLLHSLLRDYARCGLYYLVYNPLKMHYPKLTKKGDEEETVPPNVADPLWSAMRQISEIVTYPFLVVATHMTAYSYPSTLWETMKLYFFGKTTNWTSLFAGLTPHLIYCAGDEISEHLMNIMLRYLAPRHGSGGKGVLKTQDLSNIRRSVVSFVLSFLSPFTQAALLSRVGVKGSIMERVKEIGISKLQVCVTGFLLMLNVGLAFMDDSTEDSEEDIPNITSIDPSLISDD